MLLIDDSHEDLFLAKRLLARAGVNHPVVTLDDGEEAMAYLRAAGRPNAGDQLPLVIFCDVKMDGRSGFDVLKWVRAQGSLHGVPFYMLSGADLEIDRQRAAELGATGYLAKFPRPEVLQRIIEDARRS